MNWMGKSIKSSAIHLFGWMRHIECILWEMSSLMRHYLSPMDFVTLDSPNLITNNDGGM